MIERLSVDNQTMNVVIHQHSRSAPNVIFIMTPISSADDELSRSFYANLTSYNNIFAFDFIGLGKSSGGSETISYPMMKKAVLRLLEYIAINYSDDIHVYGGTGTGGILAQSLIGDEDINPYVKSLSQFGVANFSDLSIMGSTLAYKLLAPLINTLTAVKPSLTFKFQIPKYTGYNAEKESQWYSEVISSHPGCFDMKLPLVSTLLRIFLDKQSPLRKSHGIPVLVLAARHDRYYSVDYVNKYYDSLGGKKRIAWIDDSHLCFTWNEKSLSDEVKAWIKEHSITKTG